MKYVVEVAYVGPSASFGSHYTNTMSANSTQEAVNKVRRTLPENYAVRKVMAELEDWK